MQNYTWFDLHRIIMPVNTKCFLWFFAFLFIHSLKMSNFSILDRINLRLILFSAIYFLFYLLFTLLFYNNKANYRSYGAACNSWNIPCDSTLGLICSYGTGTDCKCPTTYGANYCDCPNTHYWNGTRCGIFIIFLKRIT